MYDRQTILNQATAAGEQAVHARGEIAQAYFRNVARAQRPAVKSLLAALVNKQIDRKTFDRELRAEARVMRAELQAHGAIGKTAAQTAAKAFSGTVSRALRPTSAKVR